jgi:ubiquinone/menaquinone biosynthesis C-methylase UbiE
LYNKIKGSQFEEIIALHKCRKDQIGVSDTVDFVLVFYMLHEVKNQDNYLKEIYSLLKPNGKVLLVEPPFHVSKSDFIETINKAKIAGLVPVESPKVFMGRTAVFKKG